MNTINRHNYEEFFLLYIDAELNEEQRNAVELFLEQNPDLVPEFEMFKLTTLQADETIFFSNKEDLYKTESPTINTTNYEGFFLLNIDNELSLTEREAVEKFVLQHPALQEEFSLLKQTVFAPQTIVFAGKDILYRKEETRRVIPFNWLKLAVAAAFIGLGIAGLWLFISPKKENNIASGTIVVKKDTTTADKNNNIPVPLNSTINNQPVAVNDNAAVKATLNKNTVTRKEIRKIPEKNNQQAQDNNIPANDIALTNTENPRQHTDNNSAIASVPEVDVNIINSDNNAHAINTSAALAYNTQQTENTLPLVYKELDTNQDDRSLYVGSLNLNKDKVKGLFRKVGQIFSDKTRSISNNEDGKLQVANLEFDTNK